MYCELYICGTDIYTIHNMFRKTQTDDFKC